MSQRLSWLFRICLFHDFVSEKCPFVLVLMSIGINNTVNSFMKTLIMVILGCFALELIVSFFVIWCSSWKILFFIASNQKSVDLHFPLRLSFLALIRWSPMLNMISNAKESFSIHSANDSNFLSQESSCRNFFSRCFSFSFYEWEYLKKLNDILHTFPSYFQNFP